MIEENQIMKKWYESFGFKHIKIQKFDFFRLPADIGTKSYINNDTPADH